MLQTFGLQHFYTQKRQISRVSCGKMGKLFRKGRMNMTIRELFDLEHTLAKNYLEGLSHPWEALEGIGALISSLGSQLEGYRELAPRV